MTELATAAVPSTSQSEAISTPKFRRLLLFPSLRCVSSGLASMCLCAFLRPKLPAHLDANLEVSTTRPPPAHSSTWRSLSRVQFKTYTHF